MFSIPSDLKALRHRLQELGPEEAAANRGRAGAEARRSA